MLDDRHKLLNQITRAKTLRDELTALDNQISQKMQQSARRVTAADEAQMIAAQARADSLFKDLGRVGAPPPIPSFETPGEYRHRLADDLKKFSGRWKDKNLTLVAADEAAFGEVEGMIYADAIEYAANPHVAPGEMIAIRKEGPSPATLMTKYVGSPSAWMNEIAGPVRQYVTEIHVPEFRRVYP